MGVDLTIGGASAIKAITSMQNVVSSTKEAAMMATQVAQGANLGAAEAEQAFANLQQYAFGVGASSVPATAAVMPPPSVQMMQGSADAKMAAVDSALLWGLMIPNDVPKKEGSPSSMKDFL